MPCRPMKQPFDPRLTPVRDDLAAASLRDAFPGRRYSEGQERQVSRDACPLRFRPDVAAGLESQLILGEIFTVFDEQDGWCWGQNRRDGYVGYVPASYLRSEVVDTDHQVVARSTHTYPGPDIKLMPTGQLGMCAEVKVVDTDGSFLQIDSGEWIYARHLVSSSYAMPDLVATALKFTGTPYLWGGRSSQGLDCSALIQFALRMARIDAPRDSDQQAASVGVDVAMADPIDLSLLEEGDLIFFPGHVGIYVEHWRFLHANAYDMQVSVHNLSEVLDRAKAADAGISGIRRIYHHADPAREIARKNETPVPGDTQ
jgi:cell wall-associated NlpC family hydrolase